MKFRIWFTICLCLLMALVVAFLLFRGPAPTVPPVAKVVQEVSESPQSISKPKVTEELELKEEIEDDRVEYWHGDKLLVAEKENDYSNIWTLYLIDSYKLPIIVADDLYDTRYPLKNPIFEKRDSLGEDVIVIDLPVLGSAFTLVNHLIVDLGEDPVGVAKVTVFNVSGNSLITVDTKMGSRRIYPVFDRSHKCESVEYEFHLVGLKSVDGNSEEEMVLLEEPVRIGCVWHPLGETWDTLVDLQWGGDYYEDGLIDVKLYIETIEATSTVFFRQL